ncbi:MAG: RNA-binding protein [Deltaproteobacteria bacterium]|nr:MAG: RNA-binding protein [Deltaproteobacteria bacterium]
MCEAAVFLKRGGDDEELLLEDVCIIRPDEETGGLFLQNIFGEQRIVKATFDVANLSGHRIVLKAAN